MDTQTQAPETTTVHAPKELALEVSAAYGDSATAVANRVKKTRKAADAGITMTTLADDLKALKASADKPGEINAVSSTTLGTALATADAIILTGTALGSVGASEIKAIHDGVKHVKVKAFKAALKVALSTLGDDATAENKFAALVDVARVAVSTHVATKTREPRPATGSDADADGAESTGSAPVVAPAELSPLEVLHTITRMVQNGTLEYSADLQNAVSQLADATTKARKFARQLAAA